MVDFERTARVQYGNQKAGALIGLLNMVLKSSKDMGSRFELMEKVFSTDSHKTYNREKHRRG